MSVSCGDGQYNNLAIKYQELLSQQMTYTTTTTTLQQLQVPHPLLATVQTLYFNMIIAVTSAKVLWWKSILVILFSPRHYCGLMVQAEVQTLTDPLDEVKRKVSVEKKQQKVDCW